MSKSLLLKTQLDHAIAILENIISAGTECGVGDTTWEALYGVQEFLARISDEVETLN
ncbi:hypothetical protein KQI82_06310 [Oscillibacter sp. MSJ-2]|uniref:Uncharacterized protein n=1 Tax=Dysosmobacter acutus TaxID=2841504 RepID=A0ABS6F8N4_9FIRM|nr:hypothetical protein [Dysosmobacter acutus]MBU5626532.1 hypothetical protein [Dysosmobacter acutus]